MSNLCTTDNRADNLLLKRRLEESLNQKIHDEPELEQARIASAKAQIEYLRLVNASCLKESVDKGSPLSMDDVISNIKYVSIQPEFNRTDIALKIDALNFIMNTHRDDIPDSVLEQLQLNMIRLLNKMKNL